MSLKIIVGIYIELNLRYVGEARGKEKALYNFSGISSDSSWTKCWRSVRASPVGMETQNR